MRKISLSAKKEKRAALLDQIDNINDNFVEAERERLKHGERTEE